MNLKKNIEMGVKTYMAFAVIVLLMALGIYLLTIGTTDNYVSGGLTLGISVILAIALFFGKWNMSENARLAREDYAPDQMTETEGHIVYWK